MASVPVRASDAERERALRALRAHYAAGRLEADELEERVAKATAARSRDELRALLSDLPSDRGVRAARAAERVDRAALRGHAKAYGLFNAAAISTWALTGAGAFWPVWTLLPWGAVLASHAYGSRAMRRATRRKLGEGPRRRRLTR